MCSRDKTQTSELTSVADSHGPKTRQAQDKAGVWNMHPDQSQ
jgi:hypothetical protein